MYLHIGIFVLLAVVLVWIAVADHFVSPGPYNAVPLVALALGATVSGIAPGDAPHWWLVFMIVLGLPAYWLTFVRDVDTPEPHPFWKVVSVMAWALIFFNIAVIATAQLAEHFGASLSGRHDYTGIAEFYLWQFADAIPVLKVPDSANWDMPLEYHGVVMAAAVIAFKVIVIYLIIRSLLKAWQRRRQAKLWLGAIERGNASLAENGNLQPTDSLGANVREIAVLVDAAELNGEDEALTSVLRQLHELLDRAELAEPEDTAGEPGVPSAAR